MGGGSCEVCKEAPPKYKCPACRTPYCSVACFKNHKDNFCQKTTPLEEVSKSSLQEEVTRSCGLLEDGTDCPNNKDQLPSLLPENTCPTQSLNALHSTNALEVEDPSWLVDKNRLRSLEYVWIIFLFCCSSANSLNMPIPVDNQRFLTSLVHNNELQLSVRTLPLKSGRHQG
ncbi:hypothetical protein ABZP36_015528 [Zizania latifolia]